MNLIKNAFLYFAALPDLATMTKHLEKLPFKPIGESMRMRTSFVPNETTKELVTPVQGGYSFTYRRDEKILPQAAINSELNNRVREIEERDGRVIDKKERNVMKEQVTQELLRIALVKTTETNTFYHKKTGIFVIATSGAGIADGLIADLLKISEGVDSRKAGIADLNYILTNRLLERIRDGEPAGLARFGLGNYIQMKDQEGNKATFETDGNQDPTDGIEEAARTGCQVERIELTAENISFRLTKAFVFKSITFDSTASDENWNDDVAGYWRHEAGVQLLLFVDAVEDLCELFGYRPEATKTDKFADQSANGLATTQDTAESSSTNDDARGNYSAEIDLVEGEPFLA